MKKADQLIAKNRERWHTARINEDELNTVINQLGVSERLAKILLARQIGDVQTLRSFLEPEACFAFCVIY